MNIRRQEACLLVHACMGHAWGACCVEADCRPCPGSPSNVLPIGAPQTSRRTIFMPLIVGCSMTRRAAV